MQLQEESESGREGAALSPEAAELLTRVQLVLSRAHPMTDGQYRQLDLTLAASGGELLAAIEASRNSYWALSRAEYQLTSHGEAELGPISPEEVERLQLEYEQSEAELRSRTYALGTTPEELQEFLDSFPSLFIGRAKEIADVQLMVNLDLAIAERDRYALDEATSAEALESLRAAASHIRDAATEAENFRSRSAAIRTDFWDDASDVAGPRSGSSVVDLRAAQREEGQARARLELAIEVWLAEFPILGTFDIFNSTEPARIAREAEFIEGLDDEQLSDLVGWRVQEVVENIYAASAAIRYDELQVWHLPDIVQMTAFDLGIAERPSLLELLAEHFAEVERDQAFIDLFLGATALVGGVLAAVASGGLAVAAGVAALAASSTQARRSLERYLIETDAELVALDPELADISENEPTLFWLVVDLVSIGLDASGAVRVFRAVRDTARAVEIGRGALGFDELLDALRAEGISDPRLIHRVSARLGVQPVDGSTVELRELLDQIDNSTLSREQTYAKLRSWFGRDPGELAFLVREHGGSRVFSAVWEAADGSAARAILSAEEAAVRGPVEALELSPQALARARELPTIALRALDGVPADTLREVLEVVGRDEGAWATFERLLASPGRRNAVRSALQAGNTTAESLRIFADEHFIVALRSDVTLEDAFEAQRRLAGGDVEALRIFGVDPPRGFASSSTEWGLGQAPDGSLALVRGDPRGVAWVGETGDLRALAHTHPPRLDTSFGEGSMDLTEALLDSQNRLAIMPSSQDVDVVFAHGVEEHRVATAFRYLDNGHISLQGDGPVLEFVITDIVEVGEGFMHSTMSARAGGRTLWTSRVESKSVGGSSLLRILE